VFESLEHDAQVLGATAVTYVDQLRRSRPDPKVVQLVAEGFHELASKKAHEQKQ
jgi:hypothetical protein